MAATVEQLVNDAIGLPGAPYCLIGKYIARYTGVGLCASQVCQLMKQSPASPELKFKLNLLPDSEVAKLPVEEQLQHKGVRSLIRCMTLQPETLVFKSFCPLRSNGYFWLLCRIDGLVADRELSIIIWRIRRRQCRLTVRCWDIFHSRCNEGDLFGQVQVPGYILKFDLI